MSYLCLVDNPLDYENFENFDIYSIYKNHSVFLRIIRYMHHRLKIFNFFKYIWLDKWRKFINQYDGVLIFDSIFDYYPLEFIRKYNSNIPIIFCYRNRVDAPITHSILTKDPNIIREKFNAKLYSYNLEDCEKYKMHYYLQFHTISQKYKYCNYLFEYDIYFVGKDKGRLEMVKNLEKTLKKQNIKYKFDIIPDKKRNYTLSEKKYLQGPLKYTQVIENCCKGRCILELVGASNKGITYRVIESIVLRRKLVTNNLDLIDSEIYDPDNMFILGIDNINNLSSFITSPYINNDFHSIVQSFQQFCNNIFTNQNEDSSNNKF